jgi:hypothetical protein
MMSRIDSWHWKISGINSGRWNWTMLNLCGIVVAILKMVTGRNFSMSGINSGHHNLVYRCEISISQMTMDLLLFTYMFSVLYSCQYFDRAMFLTRAKLRVSLIVFCWCPLWSLRLLTCCFYRRTAWIRYQKREYTLVSDHIFIVNNYSVNEIVCPNRTWTVSSIYNGLSQMFSLMTIFRSLKFKSSLKLWTKLAMHLN